MSPEKLATEIAVRVPDRRVYAFSEENGCSTMAARATLEAEAFSDVTGAPLDYHADWRERCRFCGQPQSRLQFTCGTEPCVSKATEEGRS